MAIALVKGAKAIAQLINTIRADGKVLDDSIQLAALSCVSHATEHGDVTLACELFKALPKGARSKALTEWFVQYSQLTVNTGLKAKELPFILDRTKALDLEAANANPWYNCKPEKHPSEEFDLIKAMEALLTRADSAAKKGLTIKGADKLLQLRVLAGTVGAGAVPTAFNDSSILTEQEAA